MCATYTKADGKRDRMQGANTNTNEKKDAVNDADDDDDDEWQKLFPCVWTIDGIYYI